MRRLWLLILMIPIAVAACSTTPSSPTPTTPPAATCSYALGITTLSMAGVGGTATIGVSTNAGCAWTAASGGSFVTVTSASSATGPGTVSITVAENLGDARSATLTIAGQTVTVNQAAGDPVFGNWAGTITKGAGCAASLPSSVQWTGLLRRNAGGFHEFVINIPAAGVVNQTVNVTIMGNTLQFAVVVDALYTFTGNLASDRRSLTGSFSGGTCSGTWSGSRQ